MNGTKTEVGGVTTIAGVNEVILFEFYPNSSPKGVWQLETFLKGIFSIIPDESSVGGIFRVKLIILQIDYDMSANYIFQ